MTENIKDTSTLWSKTFTVTLRVVVTPPKGMRVPSSFADILHENVSDALRLYGIETQSIMVVSARSIRGKYKGRTKSDD